MQTYGFKIDFQPIVEVVDTVSIPKMYKVRQKFKKHTGFNFNRKLREELNNKQELLKTLKGKKVCIAAGSRGINNIADVVRQVVDTVKKYGGQPFIIPAMGSHGGATAEGQKSVLKELGIYEESVGAPIISSMDVDYIGSTDEGIPVYTSKDALNADAVILVNRVKPHTSFRGDIESGLVKMCVIGLGKQKGAELCHKMGFYNFAERLKEMAKIIMLKVPILLGVALIEDSYDETVDVRVLKSEEFFTVEPELLNKARSLMPKILIDNLDVLIVDELGKDISGDGMDPNITGRFASEYVKGELKVNRIVVLRLTDKTEGNANGIGMADVTTLRVLNQTDFTKGYINSITAAITNTVRFPIVMPNDYLAIKAAIKTSNNLDYSGENCRIVRIKNTLKLENIYISEALLVEVKNNPQLEVVEGPLDFKFDEAGQLLTGW
ncbi:DUF362 domain-containing protein [Thermoanaerobacter mathranii]|uniref:DUF362 domain-containing protein n=1 Tax=Thermoanaerobacter mathranii TaxID=583357 RepID=UPI003D6A9905